jgi:RNA polymerase subunit RPABC4/transcription elongation factor Spt4
MLVDFDAKNCPFCGRINPFNYSCPDCSSIVDKKYNICPGCGRSLRLMCPHCKAQTFAQDICEACGKSLMVICSNKRCGKPQFFQNTMCTVCGKKIKK